MPDAQPNAIAAWIQGHGAIENRLHLVRDVVFDEDPHQLHAWQRTPGHGHAAQHPISLNRLSGQPKIAAALRHHSRDSQGPIELLTTA